jgi:hypothetical protein
MEEIFFFGYQDNAYKKSQMATQISDLWDFLSNVLILGSL